jgi:hypothetical protein
VVAQPLRRAEELVALWLCVAPLRLGGLRGKKSTPSAWLGGTGELIDVGKQEQEQLGKGAQEAPSTGFNSDNKAKVWTCLIE